MVFSHKLLFKAPDIVLHAMQIFLWFLLDFMCSHCTEHTAPIYRIQLPLILALILLVMLINAMYIVDKNLLNLFFVDLSM